MTSKMAPKRKVNVRGQPHSLAYINKDEARMLRRMGGSGKPGPSGIPTYIPDDGNRGGGGFADAPSGPSMGEYGGGPSTDPGNYSLDNYNYDAPSKGMGQSQASLDAQNRAAAAQAAATAKARAKEQLQQRNKLAAKKSLLDFLPGSLFSKFVGAKMRDIMGKQLDAPNFVSAIFDKKGKYVGNVTKNFLGLDVYTGMQVENYTGPHAGLVSQDTSGGDGGDAIETKVVKDYDGGKLSEDKTDGVNLKVPDAPTAPDVGDGDASEDAKRRSKMGKESTISTTNQGLLSTARTRNRSLMSGLIS